jgi:Putative zinc-finger
VNCEGVYRRVSSYVDGDLEATLVQDFELHLKKCGKCTALLKQTELTVRLYRDSDLVDFPAEVKTRLHETLRKKMQRKMN